MDVEVDGGEGRALGAEWIITSDRENQRLITSDRQEQRSRIMGITCAPIYVSCRERWIGASLPKDRGLSFDLSPAFDSSLGGNGCPNVGVWASQRFLPTLPALPGA